MESPVQEETGRLPGANYKPNNWSPICSEMERFYTLPGGGWGLKKELRPKEPEPMKPPPGNVLLYRPTGANFTVFGG